MTAPGIEACSACVRAYLAAYAAKDLPGIAALLAEDVQLRDWNQAVQGRTAALAETRANFDAARTLQIDVLHLHATARSAAAELRIVVDGHLELFVVDCFELDDQGRIRALRAYKGIG